MAVIAKQRYKLDVAPKGGWVIVYASQHDNGAREIEFEITNQGNAFSIPASINISVQGIKSNKSYFSHSCSYFGNIVTMALADDMTDVIGKAICVLKFTNQSNQKLATAKFVLNVDTDSSSEGIIIDTEAEEIFNQMLNDIRAQAASISADIAELQSMVGSPLVASTASAMTDHNKIYVYTGSESGYTNGNWYYWNGSAWTSGGVYNSTAFETDKTLSVENMAADAKIVGDNLSLYEFTPTTNPGYWGANGSIYPPSSSGEQQEVYTEMVRVYGKKVKYKLSYPETKSMWLCILYVYADGTKNRVVLIGRNEKYHSDIVTIPENVIQFSFSYRTFGNCDFSIIYLSKEMSDSDREAIDAVISSNYLDRYNFKDFDINNLELVYTITTQDNSRYNYTTDSFTGLFMCIPEYTDSLYTHKLSGTGNDFRVVDNLFILCSNTRINMYMNPVAVAGQKLRIYKITEGGLIGLDYRYKPKDIYDFRLTINDYVSGMRVNNLDVIGIKRLRVSSDVVNYCGMLKVIFDGSTGYKFAIQTFDRNTREKIEDSGWKFDEYTFFCPSYCCFVVVVAKESDENIVPEEVPENLVTVVSNHFVRNTLPAIKDVELLQEQMSVLPKSEEFDALNNSVESNKNAILSRLRNESPCYDHLFVNDSNPIIPHESVYHIRLSKKMGFGIIEANVAVTSDNVFFVNHLSSGKFGNYFKHVDGVTDISNISASSVTWDWIIENVRYNTATVKYQTRPVRLDEFLQECNAQNIVPFVGRSVAPNGTVSHEVAKKYMGETGYIAYGGVRSSVGNTPIYFWDNTNIDPQDILSACKQIGAPLIWGTQMARFDDSIAKTIIETLHDNGFFVGVSYVDANWEKYREMGADFNGTQSLINRIFDGNICSCSSVFDWDDYVITGSPINTNGVLTFENAGTIKPIIQNDNSQGIRGYDYEVVFSGSIDVVSAVESRTITHDTMLPEWYSKPIYNDSVEVIFNVSAGTVVQDLYFKANKFL